MITSFVRRADAGISRTARAVLALVLIVAVAIEVGILVLYAAPASLVDGEAMPRALGALFHDLRVGVSSLDPLTLLAVGAAAVAITALVGLHRPARAEPAGPERAPDALNGASDEAPAPARPAATAATAADIVRLPGAASDSSRDTERLHRLEARLAQAEAARAAFVSGMSHELRIPMNGIVGNGDLLLACQLPERERGYAEAVTASTRDLLSVIDDLLDHSRIGPETLALERVRFRIRDALEESCRPFTARARDHNIELTVLEDDGVPLAAIGDAARLRRMIKHLVRNAIEATGSGGEISVRLSRVAGGSPGDGQFQCTVRDTGAGMTSERQIALFARLNRAAETERAEGDGTGIETGLVTAQRIAGSMGGELHVRSRLGAGTSVTVTVNLTEVDEEGSGQGAGAHDRVGLTGPLGKSPGQADLRAPRPSRAAPAAHVLIVEDNEVNQAVARGLLENLGCTVSVAANGREALDITAGTSFDMILMDCRMPEMDGYEATGAIRASAGPNRTTPIVALTANAMSGDRQRCIDAGMDDYLAKPVWGEDLEKSLRRWVAEAGSDEAADPAEPSPPSGAVGPAVRSIDDVLADVAMRGAGAIVRDIETALHEEARERLQGASERLLERARRIHRPALLAAAEALSSAAGRSTSTRDELTARASEAIEQWTRARSEPGTGDTDVRDAA